MRADNLGALRLAFRQGSAKDCRVLRPDFDVGWARPDLGCVVGGKMRILRLLMAVAMALVTTAVSSTGANAQERAWLQIESYPAEDTARARAAAYAEEFPNVQVFQGGNWHAIVLGPYAPEEAAGVLSDLRRAGRVPGDAFITDGAAFVDVGAMVEPLTPEDPAAEVVAVEPTPTEAPDETLSEARASEAELTKDDRMALQEALKWNGFYTSTIDGAFGKGTRNSMAAWQEANGYEPTGVLTTLQRATLTANHSADLAEFGFETITEPEAGIEITLPMALVQFDHYEPPFVHYAEKNSSGLRIMLISEPGGSEALAGLYDILQTLEVVPATGQRSLKDKSFSIEAASDSVQSLAYAQTKDGLVKGYLVVWNPADAERMARILPALQTYFRAVGSKALDPGMVPMEASARAGMLAGLELRQPKLVASGFFVDDKGHVATALATVATCTKVTIGAETEATVIAQDDARGIALLAPKAALSPLAFAALTTASPRPGADVAVSGYSFGAQLPAPVLTFGSFDAATSPDGTAGMGLLTAPVMAGDMGGPVLDMAGSVVGIVLPAASGAAKVLPQGAAQAADAASLSTLLQGAGLVTATNGGATAISPDALNAAAEGMTVQVSCWED